MILRKVLNLQDISLSLRVIEINAIVFSMSHGLQESPNQAIEFLESHPVVAWGSNTRIDTSQIALSEASPLRGYIYHEGRVKYKIKIISITRYKRLHRYPDLHEIPEEWKKSRWKTFFRFTEFMEVSPKDVSQFRRPNGQAVKRPVRNYVKLID
ncbi:MAG: hypothetical protein ABIJ40_20930 [Bacteroidota bacterium]